MPKQFPQLGNLNKKNDHFGTNYFKKKTTGCGQKKRNKFQGRNELGKYEKTLMKELAKKYPHLGNLNQNNDHFGTSYFKKEPTGCGHRRIPKKKLE